MSILAFTCINKLAATSSFSFRCRSLISRKRIIISKMSTNSSSLQLTHTINLPSQLTQPLTVVAAPGVSDSDFRNAIGSSLFEQWLNNIQNEKRLLADGSLSLKQVLIQGVDIFGKRVGYVKFKADIIDKETGQKVPFIVFAR